jgi:REase_DpnII-MboI
LVFFLASPADEARMPPVTKTDALTAIGSVLGLRQRVHELIRLESWGRNTLESFAEYRARATSVIERLSPAASLYRVQLSNLLAISVDNIDHITQITSQLSGLLEALRKEYVDGHSEPPQTSDIPAFRQLERLLRRLHQVVLSLSKRPRGRDPLVVLDEYDVQYLLQAQLRLEFDDVRPEEWVPSYAGKSAKMDFLLKRHQIVIETKMSRDRLGAGEVGSELLEDIGRYKEHPDCRTLVCFVYDPDHRVENPAGLKDDLERQSSERLAVVVIICQH